jgi:hypothetical protein
MASRGVTMMKPKALYLLLCVLGTILPYLFFVQFLHEHGLNLRLFFEQLLQIQLAAISGWMSSCRLFVFGSSFTLKAADCA